MHKYSEFKLCSTHSLFTPLSFFWWSYSSSKQVPSHFCHPFVYGPLSLIRIAYMRLGRRYLLGHRQLITATSLKKKWYPVHQEVLSAIGPQKRVGLLRPSLTQDEILMNLIMGSSCVKDHCHECKVCHN